MPALVASGVSKGGQRPHSSPESTPPAQDALVARLTTPPLAGATLPFRPSPSIPVTDRTPLALPALVSGAVALDVLTTGLKHLTSGPQILADLNELLLTVGALGGIDATAQERLVAHAHGPAGQMRGRLAMTLAARLTQPATELPPTEATAVRAFAPSTPDSVSKALDVIAAGTAIAIREARLRLEASRQATAYTLV